MAKDKLKPRPVYTSTDEDARADILVLEGKVKLKQYSSLADLGLTAPASITEILTAMEANSMLVMEAIGDTGSGSYNFSSYPAVAIVPEYAKYGTLIIHTDDFRYHDITLSGVGNVQASKFNFKGNAIGDTFYDWSMIRHFEVAEISTAFDWDTIQHNAIYSLRISAGLSGCNGSPAGTISAYGLLEVFQIGVMVVQRYTPNSGGATATGNMFTRSKFSTNPWTTWSGYSTTLVGTN